MGKSKNDTIVKTEVIEVKSDTITEGEPKKKKERLEDIVDYDSDEQYHDYKNQFTYLVKNAMVNYTDLNIEADYIEINWDSGDVYAVGEQDSTGRIIAPSKFTQGGRTIEYNSFAFNLRTKQGRAFNVRTEESMGSDKGVVDAGVVKQYNDTVSGMRKVKYTTDELYISKEDSIADYHLETSVAKYLRGKEKTVISGPIFMKIYDVSMPLGLPFAFLPMGDTRSAGILLPSFGEEQSRGFYLNGLGFYYPLGDYVDIAVTADIYTRGSLGLQAISQYKKNYRYNGSFNFNWSRTVSGIKGLDDYTSGKNFSVRWSHKQDSKANPNLTFNANVNFTSGGYYTQSTNNNYNLNGSVFNNSSSSSITLNKTFPNSPFTASIGLGHSQSNNTSSDDPATYVFTLPSVNVNMSNIYPFAPKTGAKKGLLQKLSVNYGFEMKNQIDTDEDNLFTSAMWDEAENGARHKVSLGTSTNLLNYFTWNISGSYQDVWTLKTASKSWDSTEEEEVSTDIYGFDSYRTFSASTGLSTVIYGTKIFGNEDDDKLIKGIRHMMTPSLSFSYTPDFGSDTWGYYDNYIIEVRDDQREDEVVKYSRFEDGLYGAPSSGLSQSVGLSLGNTLEMKVRSRKDSTGMKKIKIFETLNLSTSYNFAADSMRLSTISFSGRSSLFNSKMAVSFGGAIDPYKIYYEDEEDTGTRIDKLGNFRLTRYNVGLSYSLDNTTFSKREMNYNRRGEKRYKEYYFDDDGYAQFLMPWKLSFTLNHNISKPNRVSSTTTSTLSLNGSISPTPYWSISGNASFNLDTRELTYTSLNLSRDLRSFTLNFGMVPFGTYQTWNFFVGIKANFLRDTLKYEEKNFNTSGANF